jgi:hypothetical protein
MIRLETDDAAMPAIGARQKLMEGGGAGGE